MRTATVIVLLATQCMALNATGTDRAAELAQVVTAERAFAARAQVVNARQAFAEFFAPDALLFAPFAAPAFPRLLESPDWSVNIQWRPVAAAVSARATWDTRPVRRSTAARRPSHRSATALHLGVGAPAGRPVPGSDRYRHRSRSARGARTGLVATVAAAA